MKGSAEVVDMFKCLFFSKSSLTQNEMQTVNIWTWARTHQWRIQGKNRGWGGGGGGRGGDDGFVRAFVIIPIR